MSSNLRVNQNTLGDGEFFHYQINRLKYLLVLLSKLSWNTQNTNATMFLNLNSGYKIDLNPQKYFKNCSKKVDTIIDMATNIAWMNWFMRKITLKKCKGKLSSESAGQ